MEIKYKCEICGHTSKDEKEFKIYYKQLMCKKCRKNLEAIGGYKQKE